MKGQVVVPLHSTVQEASFTGIESHAREGQISVLTGASGTKFRVRRDLGGKSQRFSGSDNFVKNVEKDRRLQ